MTNKQRRQNERETNLTKQIDEDISLSKWIDAGPSRRLRKIYAQIETLEREMEATRKWNPFPEHAPTTCRLVSEKLSELKTRWFRLTERAARLDGIDGFED